MNINPGNLRTLGTSFNALFSGGLGQAAGREELIATVVPSSTGKEEYGWLGKLPGVREWIGDRVINNISISDYAVRNRDFELTIEVDRNDIEDDNIGIYSPLFTEMGRATGVFPSELAYGLLKSGFTTNCYDGQYFFDVDHPVLAADGTTRSVSNTGGGSGAMWVLMDASRAIKPIILQKRKAFQFTPMTSPDSPNVFHQKKFVYGSDARYGAGFGFWQFAYGSKQALSVANFAAAFAAIEGMKGDYDRPLGLRPTLLLVDPSNREAAQRIVKNMMNDAGASNPWAGTVELEVVPWLA